MKKFSKQSTLLFLAGIFIMSFGTMTRTFFHIAEDADDFLKGLGVSLMVGIFIREAITASKARNNKAV
jgi:hypothetical protein